METSIDIKKNYSEYVKKLETYIMFQIKQETLRLEKELTEKGREPIELSMGAPSQPPPQFVIDALKDALDEPGIHKYSTPKGEMFFLEAVAHRMNHRFGVNLDPKSEIFSLIGSKEGIQNFFRTIINPTLDEKEQDIILIPDPGYASYKEQIKVIGGKAYPMILNYENKFMPDLYEIEKQLESEGLSPSKIKAVVINYPNNPLGATATREYLKHVVDFARSRNIIVMSDLAYADMYFDNQEPPASILEIEGARDVAIEFHSLSKPYSMTGWRVGWACGNKDAIAVLGKMKSTVDTGVFKALQKASSVILRSEEGDKYIQECNKQYQKKQEILLKGFKELGWDIESLIIPQATFYLWLPIPPRYKKASDFTQEMLEKAGVVVVPGIAFGDYGEGLRVSIVAPDDKLYEVIERMKTDGFTFN